MPLIINIDSIMDKVEARLNEKDMQDKMKSVKKEILSGKKKSSSGKTYSPEAVAEQFVDVLKSNIEGSIYSKKVIDAINEFNIGFPMESGDDIYIKVSYAKDMSRESLDPEEYPDGIFSLAALFNEGAPMHGAVFGVHHGKEIKSTMFTPAYHFEENAIEEFMGKYADEMHVKEII